MTNYTDKYIKAIDLINTPMKTNGLSDLIIFLSIRNIKYKDTERIKKTIEKIYHINSTQKKISLAILIIEKVDSRTKTIMNHKENREYFTVTGQFTEKR